MNTSIGEIILKLESPIAHLVFSGRHLLLSPLGFNRLYLTQIDGAIV